MDLPSYGYAQVARKDSSQFNAMATNYIELASPTFAASSR